MHAGVMRAAVLIQIERSEAIPVVETTFQNSSVAKEEAWKHLLDKSSNGDNYQKK